MSETKELCGDSRPRLACPERSRRVERSAASQRRQSPFHTGFQRHTGIDDDLEHTDCLEPGFHFEIKLKVAIAGRMAPLRDLRLKPLPHDLIGAHALDDPPGLVHTLGRANRVFDLIAPRKCPSVDKYKPGVVLPQKKASGFKHYLQTKIILGRGVFYFVGGEQRLSNLVFIEHAAARAASKLVGERSLASAWKPSHQYDHRFN